MTRMLRRATGGNVIPVLKEDDDASSDEDIKNKPNNRFEALLAESDQDDRNTNSADDESENVKPAATKGVKKKSKKSKKKAPKSKKDNEQDEFDKTLEDFKLSYENAQPSTSGMDITENSSSNHLYAEVLQLKLSHLNERYEVKKKFGLEIPSAFSGHDIARNKQSKFIAEVLPYWPQLAQNSGLSMKMNGTKDGCAHFEFEHSKSYQLTTNQVIEILQASKVEEALSLFGTTPFHVDLIMQVAEIAKQAEEMEKCLHLVERAVYLMEKAFHINFSSHLLKGTCCLEYKYQVNRTFYRVMFQHMVLLTSRASHRTALEYAKMIFSLDPQDPYAIIIIIDSLALKCKEYEWLLNFIKCWMAVRSRPMALPNLLYSKALAEYHIAKKGGKSLQNATDSLKDAIAKYPHIIPMLVKELPPLAKKLPSEVMSHAAFSTDKTPDALSSQMYVIYVKYTHSQWERDDDVLDWLASTVKNLTSDPKVQTSPDWLNYLEQRKSLFAKAPLSIKRHIFLGDLEGVPLLTRGLSESTIFTWDPFPPKNSVNIYSTENTRTQERMDRLTTSMINAIFRSLDPSFTLD